MRQRTRFESESSYLRLAEYDQTQIDAGVREYIVGEKVELSADKFGFGSALIEKVSWSIPGRITFFYGGDANKSILIDLDKKYFTNRNIAFYWVDADDNRQVVCDAIVRKARGTDRVTISRTFNVKGPKLVSLTAEVSKPKIVTDRGGSRRISFGDRKTKPGIAWNCKIDMPAGFSGSIKDLQLVKLGRKKKQLLGRGSREFRRMVKGTAFPNKDYLLDIGTMGDEACKPDRAGDDPTYSGVIKAAAGKTAIFDMATDSPSDGLASLDTSYFVAEDFKYFIFFKPDKANSIWVPVGVADWFWKAEARKVGSNWRIINGSGGVKGEKGKATRDFPSYNGNACDVPWDEIK
ncbi:MAG: hypothetical protein HOP17_04170 [Acidobacteria bacterium]|nr:hypothetical protein [Acidobacteriota bacterium]